MKKSSIAIVLFLVGAAGLCWHVEAGELEPPGDPEPTMVTLDQIYDKLNECTGGSCGVPKTGQTGCWDFAGDPENCAGTGQDGEYQTGDAWPDPRFTDNGDGTVTDNLTGLIWLKDQDCYSLRYWQDALDDVPVLANGVCGLTDGSVAGDWRLPNIRELHSLVDFSQSDPALPSGHPFLVVRSGSYWSSTSEEWDHGNAWAVHFYSGSAGTADKWIQEAYIWPVRGGQ